ncbi:methionine synthase reductase [Pangasianodon hypophthalmus]|uniref:methionine synthase reductase n=1 Tax=Pangasianodon hypophthalmus TaxID=310915 RepID=UPI002306E76B|nr:methionine synthase reductase [Pangasianodon hypophthalmus]XP_053083873.1 methionine synthase reductase [Pangasianodon hypophthalmus]
MPSGVSSSRFLILYGSQKGQAQSIAEQLTDQAAEHGFEAEISCLSKGDKYNLEKEHSPVVFVVSTTGDGEPPDTALKFVRKIKKKSLPRDHFSHLHYTLLALGDTNYTNFCNCGKTIDSRLQELGANHFYATGLADDGTGLEVVVDPWIDGLWEALKKIFVKMSASDLISDTSLSNGHQSVAVQEKLESSAQSLQLLDISDVDTGKSKPESETESRDAEAPLDASLNRSVAPLSQSSLSIPALPPSYLEVFLGDVPTGEEEIHVVAQGFHEVPISRALWLTRDDAVKPVILLELDMKDENISYEPGDAFDLLCPNRDTEVEDLLHRLGLYDKKNHFVHLQLLKNTKKKGARVPPYIPEKCTLQYLLTWCLEIRSIPKKAFLRSLADCTQETREKRRLQELCSREGAADYDRFVRNASVCILDLLCAFPSCTPPLSLLIEHLPKLQPRAYSAASSSLRHPGKFHIVFSVVGFPACAEHPERTGLCTGWLADRVSTIIEPYGTKQASRESVNDKALPKVHICPRLNNSFHLPSDPTVPMVMVGPGSGVAPFIGFLQQRQKERARNQDSAFGETWLFFGCRHQDRDFIFREELERFVENGTLSHLKVCFSRAEMDRNGSEPKPKYVQHALLLHAEHVARILLKENGRLYVCGDAKNMAKDVNDTLMEIIGKELQVDKLDSMKTIAKLREEKRYLQDIWS